MLTRTLNFDNNRLKMSVSNGTFTNALHERFIGKRTHRGVPSDRPLQKAQTKGIHLKDLHFLIQIGNQPNTCTAAPSKA